MQRKLVELPIEGFTEYQAHDYLTEVAFISLDPKPGQSRYTFHYVPAEGSTLHEKLGFRAVVVGDEKTEMYETRSKRGVIIWNSAARLWKSGIFERPSGIKLF